MPYCSRIPLSSPCGAVQLPDLLQQPNDLHIPAVIPYHGLRGKGGSTENSPELPLNFRADYRDSHFSEGRVCHPWCSARFCLIALY